MKLIIAGGRCYWLTGNDYFKLHDIHNTTPVSEVVSGGSHGADACGETWAKARGIPVKRFPADWKTHGRKAGPLRNQTMADYADALAIFPGGRGTADMLRRAKERGLRIFDFTGGFTNAREA